MFYKLGMQTALEQLGLLKVATNPGIAAQMRIPTWGLSGPVPPGFQREQPAATQSTPTGPAPGAGTGKGTSEQASMPQKSTDMVSSAPAPGPAAAPGPASPYRGPAAEKIKPPKDTFKPVEAETAKTLNVPKASPF